jgi:hypothetical protein
LKKSPKKSEKMEENQAKHVGFGKSQFMPKHEKSLETQRFQGSLSGRGRRIRTLNKGY